MFYIDVGQHYIYTQKCCFRYGYDPEQFADSHIPILVIGTKLDLSQTVRENSLTRTSNIAEECGADEINLVSTILPCLL